jgi:hypothetical protein
MPCWTDKFVYSPKLNHTHMCKVESVARKKEQILETPDTLGGSDLRQCETHPALHCIAKYKRQAHNTREDLSVNVY